MEKIGRIYVDWETKKIIKRGLAGGTYYATYYDKAGEHWAGWMKRSTIRYLARVS